MRASETLESKNERTGKTHTQSGVDDFVAIESDEKESHMGRNKQALQRPLLSFPRRAGRKGETVPFGLCERTATTTRGMNKQVRGARKCSRDAQVRVTGIMQARRDHD